MKTWVPGLKKPRNKRADKGCVKDLVAMLAYPSLFGNASKLFNPLSKEQ